MCSPPTTRRGRVKRARSCAGRACIPVTSWIGGGPGIAGRRRGPAAARRLIRGMRRSPGCAGRRPSWSRSWPRPVVVLCHSQEQAEHVRAQLAKWLAPRGLAFNEDKTKIVHLDEGFGFLGFSVRRYQNRKLLIKPSKAAVRRVRERLASETRSACREYGACIPDLSPRAIVEGPGAGWPTGTAPLGPPGQEQGQPGPCLRCRAAAVWLLLTAPGEGRAHPAGLERTVACERCSLRLTEVPRSSHGETLLFRTRGRGRSGSLCGRPALTRPAGSCWPGPCPMASPWPVRVISDTTPPAWRTRPVRGSADLGRLAARLPARASAWLTSAEGTDQHPAGLEATRARKGRLPGTAGGRAVRHPPLAGREPGPGPSAVPGFLVPAGYGPSALSASAGRWQP